MLYLTPIQRQEILNHAEKTYDQECCGILLGECRQAGEETHKYVRQVIPVENQWQTAISEASSTPMLPELDEQASPDPRSLTQSRRYWIDPQDLFMAQGRARDLGWVIVGIYHSHPDHGAVPSEYDRAWAWSGYSYVIVSVRQGVAQDMRSWSLDDQRQFQPEEVCQ